MFYMAFDHMSVVSVTYSPISPQGALKKGVEERKGAMRGHDWESFADCKVLRLS